MAVELEETVMREIGLGNHYNWFNGSGSCAGIRDAAIKKLPNVAKKHGLNIASKWIAHCEEASRADQAYGQQYTLTLVWEACSYAIQDAIYRKEGGKGFSPDVHQFHFFSSEGKRRYENGKRGTVFEKYYDKW